MNKILKLGLVLSLGLFFSTVVFGQTTDENKPFFAKPAYPVKLKKAGIKGNVKVQVVLNEQGKVIKATAFRGPKSLWKYAQEAALKSTLPIQAYEAQKKGEKSVINYTFDKDTPTQ